MFRKFSNQVNISTKDFYVVFILLGNAFAWFYMAPMIMDGILESMLLTEEQQIIMSDLAGTLYYFGIVVSSFIGLILSKIINRLKFIYVWTTIGIATSILPIFFSSFTSIEYFVISYIFGASFGLGIASCLSYFADVTHVENRGRIGGIILFSANMVAPILTVVFNGLDLTTTLIVFAGWRSLGLMVFFLKPVKKNKRSERKMYNSSSGIIKDKTFGFYIFAWIMFCLVERIAGPILIESLSNYVAENIIIISPILASITILIAGVLADWVGRKRIVIYGFVSLGVAYALIGFNSTELVVQYFFLVINGISAGLLSVTFIMILWGDISQSGSREMYYTIGIIPLFITSIIAFAFDGYITQIIEEPVFSVAAFFLFMAVLPLLYAPETLPAKKMELRRLRNFAEEAKKTKEKYERKMKD